MKLPEDPSLPFFSYGLFRPGQIGYSRIQPFVSDAEPEWSVEGTLLERDGLPLIDEGGELVPGWLIRLDPCKAIAAYESINAIEPDKLYVWKTTDARRGDRSERANVLFGRKPRRGSHHAEYPVWEGDKEPLFTTALVVIRRTIGQYREFRWDLEPTFQLQMAYLLLWCAIERFVSFKFHLGDKAVEKVFRLADDPAFVASLRKRVSERRHVFRTDDPDQKKVLDPNDAKKALGYYYQIRSNITHRGKSAVRDHEILLKSLAELIDIFEDVLKIEFSGSSD